MSESHPKIYVETLGHYHNDCYFNATPDLLPKRLNDYRRFFEEPELPIPFIDVKQPLPNNFREKEYKLNSLLDYINQKGWPDEVIPDFVTHKQLLQKLASSDESMEIYLVRVDGVIFMYKHDEEERIGTEYSWVFKHYLTRETMNDSIETDGTIRKGVFKASVYMGRGRKRANVLYSGKVDLIDDDNQHNEVKVISGEGLSKPYFWEEQSLRFYWQSFFGNVTQILFGLRTGICPGDKKTRPPLSMPPYSVYQVEKMDLTTLYYGARDTLREMPRKKQVKDGYTDLRDLLALIWKTVKRDGDGFVFSKEEESTAWTIRRDDDAVAEFRDCILRNVPY